MLVSTRPWLTATARSIPIGCCALRLSSAHRRTVPGPGQRQSHSGHRPQCGVPAAVGRFADRPMRYITLADNASTVHNKTERKTTMRKLCDKDGGENNTNNEVA